MFAYYLSYYSCLMLWSFGSYIAKGHAIIIASIACGRHDTSYWITSKAWPCWARFCCRKLCNWWFGKLDSILIIVPPFFLDRHDTPYYVTPKWWGNNWDSLLLVSHSANGFQSFGKHFFLFSSLKTLIIVLALYRPTSRGRIPPQPMWD